MTGTPTDWNAIGRGAALVAAGAIIGAAGVATASAVAHPSSTSSIDQAAGGFGGPGVRNQGQLQDQQQGQSNGLVPGGTGTQGGTTQGGTTQGGTKQGGTGQGGTGQGTGVLPPGSTDGSSGSDSTGSSGSMPQRPQMGGGPMVSSGGS